MDIASPDVIQQIKEAFQMYLAFPFGESEIGSGAEGKVRTPPP